MPQIPIIKDLTKGPVPLGCNLLVEFDPTSEWYNASVSIAAGWLKSGGTVQYWSFAQPPQDIRTQLQRLGLDSESSEKQGRLQIWDGYTATLGLKSTEAFALQSLKAAELSIMVTKEVMRAPAMPDCLVITDSFSVLDRFNYSKAWVEYILTRVIPARKLRKMPSIRGILRGVHNDWTYRQLEASVDGVVDFKLDESKDPLPDQKL